MDSTSGLVVSFSLMHVALSKSSVATEKDGCRDVLRELLDHGVDIEVFATDRNSQVISLLKEDDFHHINHQFDVFHLAKNISERLTVKAKKCGCEELGEWVKSVKTTCGGVRNHVNSNRTCCVTSLSL